MSLTKCAVCGGVVALDALYCPHCGTREFIKWIKVYVFPHGLPDKCKLFCSFFEREGVIEQRRYTDSNLSGNIWVGSVGGKIGSFKQPEQKEIRILRIDLCELAYFDQNIIDSPGVYYKKCREDIELTIFDTDITVDVYVESKYKITKIDISPSRR